MKKTIAILLLTLTSYAQKIYKIKGNVLDTKGIPVAGVKIETQDGYKATANFDGSFMIQTYNCEGTLRFYAYGFGFNVFEYYFDNKMNIELKNIVIK